jgi:hypothetical protein
VACLLALGGAGAARAAGDQNATRPEERTVTLAQSAKVGDTVRYRSHFTITAGAGELKVVRNSKRTIREIRDNGDLVAEVTDEGGRYTFNGSENETPSGASATLTMDRYGKLLSYKPQMENTVFISVSALHLLTLMDGIIFPNRPVKPGDSWKTELDNPAVKGKKVALKTIYIGLEKAGDVDAWKVRQTLDADTEESGVKMVGEITALLDAATGELIQAEQTVKGVSTQIGPLDWKGLVQRVRPEADETEKTQAR